MQSLKAFGRPVSAASVCSSLNYDQSHTAPVGVSDFPAVVNGEDVEEARAAAELHAAVSQHTGRFVSVIY